MGGSFLSPCRAFSSLLKERSRELFIGSDRGHVREARCRLVTAFFLAREKQRTFTWQRTRLSKRNRPGVRSNSFLLKERSQRPSWTLFSAGMTGEIGNGYAGSEGVS